MWEVICFLSLKAYFHGHRPCFWYTGRSQRTGYLNMIQIIAMSIQHNTTVFVALHQGIKQILYLPISQTGTTEAGHSQGKMGELKGETSKQII